MRRGPFPVAVDAAVFTILDAELHVLVEESTGDPRAGTWRLPGGRLEAGELPDEAARRILQSRFGTRAPYHEQLYTFGEPARAPGAPLISIAYFAVLPPRRAPRQARFEPARRPPALAPDHARILEVAIERLHTKTEYSTVPLRFLEEPFTLSEVQAVYEVLLGRPLDKRNFRRKMLALEAIEQVEGKRRGGAHRPARLFRLSPQRPYLLKERGVLFPF